MPWPAILCQNLRRVNQEPAASAKTSTFTPRAVASAIFMLDLKVSVEIKIDAWKQRSLFKKCGNALARSLSPLL
jgi:hypothetical protein